MVVNIGLCQYHWVKAANLYRPDGLRELGAPAVADVEGPKGKSPGVMRLLVRWWWRCVEAVPAMVDLLGEKMGNLVGSLKTVSRIDLCRLYGRLFPGFRR